MVSYVAKVAAAAAVLATTSHLQQHSDVALTPTQTGAVTSSAAAAAAAAAAAIQPLCLMGMPYMLSMGNYNFNAPNSSMQTLFSPTPRDIEASRDPVAVPLKHTEMPSTRVKAKDATKANAADSGVINPKASKKAPISESANQEPGAKLDDNKSVPTKSGTEDTNGNPSLPPGKMKADYASKNGKVSMLHLLTCVEAQTTWLELLNMPFVTSRVRSVLEMRRRMEPQHQLRNGVSANTRCP